MTASHARSPSGENRALRSLVLVRTISCIMLRIQPLLSSVARCQRLAGKARGSSCQESRAVPTLSQAYQVVHRARPLLALRSASELTYADEFELEVGKPLNAPHSTEIPIAKRGQKTIDTQLGGIDPRDRCEL